MSVYYFKNAYFVRPIKVEFTPAANFVSAYKPITDFMGEGIFGEANNPYPPDILCPLHNKQIQIMNCTKNDLDYLLDVACVDCVPVRSYVYTSIKSSISIYDTFTQQVKYLKNLSANVNIYCVTWRKKLTEEAGFGTISADQLKAWKFGDPLITLKNLSFYYIHFNPAVKQVYNLKNMMKTNPGDHIILYLPGYDDRIREFIKLISNRKVDIFTDSTYESQKELKLSIPAYIADKAKNDSKLAEKKLELTKTNYPPLPPMQTPKEQAAFEAKHPDLEYSSTLEKVAQKKEEKEAKAAHKAREERRDLESEVIELKKLVEALTKKLEKATVTEERVKELIEQSISGSDSSTASAASTPKPVKKVIQPPSRKPAVRYALSDTGSN